MRKNPLAKFLLFAIAWTALAGPGVVAKDFPPITEEQRTLTAVAGQPGASAVVLEEIGYLDIMEYPTDVSSKLDIRVRLKILTQEGVDAWSQIRIRHSRFVRLHDLEGRTVLPDGREIPLPKDAVFEEKSSRLERQKLTKATFPGVEVGAIIDYSYTLIWDSILFLEPWVFHNEMPTLHSEITFVIPQNMRAKPWARRTTQQEFDVTQEQTPKGLALRVQLKNLAGIPDEPYSFPRIDLSSRFMLVPEVVFTSGTQIPLMESWKSVCELYKNQIYKDFLRKGKQLKKVAKELTAGAPSPRARMEILHRFVRDEITTTGWLSVGSLQSDGADDVLESRRGTGPEKALLLHAMLEAIKLDADVIWASDLREGVTDLSVANPWWFDTVLVRVMLDDVAVFLDPSDRDLGTGRLGPYLEGTPALVYDAKNPEIIELPKAPWEDHKRKATLRLKVDEEGRVSGDGSLIYTGHHAWRHLHLGEDDAATLEKWEEKLAEDFEGYDLSEIEVEEKVEEQTMRVDFALKQRDEEVLGDEVSLLLSRPLGPVEQPFVLAKRLTPVLLSFADIDEVELDLVWPEGWEIDAFPDSVKLNNAVGALEADLQIDPSARTAKYTRRFVLSESQIAGTDYEALRKLYDIVAKHDRQAWVLILP